MIVVVTLTTTLLELVGAVEDPGTLDDEGTTLEEETEVLWLDELLAWLDTEFKMDEELKDIARLLVATLTADSEVKSVDDDAELDDTGLDAEDAMVEGVTLEGVLLETEDDPTLELVEVLCDAAGRTFVATPVAAVLIVVVKTTTG